MRENILKHWKILYDRNAFTSVQEWENMLKLFQENRLLNRNVVINYHEFYKMQLNEEISLLN